MAKSTQWAIASGNMLYYGTARTKRLAIAQHVWALDEACYAMGFPHFQDKPLSAEQKRAWRSAKEKGDRAIKVWVEEIK